MKLYYFAISVCILIIGLLMVDIAFDRCGHIRGHLNAGRYEEAARRLEQYDCPAEQKRFLETSFAPVIHSFKNQTVNILHILSKSSTLEDYQNLIDLGYDKELIAKTVVCQIDDLEFCLMLVDILPGIKPELDRAYKEKLWWDAVIKLVDYGTISHKKWLERRRNPDPEQEAALEAFHEASRKCMQYRHAA